VLENFQTGHFRHVNIEQDEIVVLFAGSLESSHAVNRFIAVQTVRLKSAPAQQANFRLVIDDENLPGGGHAGRRVGSRGEGGDS